jgi:hypothetical protein
MFRARKTENCAWSTPGSNAAKVVLLGEVLALRCPAVTNFCHLRATLGSPPLHVTRGPPRPDREREREALAQVDQP